MIEPVDDPWFIAHLHVYEAVRDGVLTTEADVQSFAAVLCLHLPGPAPPESQDRINQHIATCVFPPPLLSDLLWTP